MALSLLEQRVCDKILRQEDELVQVLSNLVAVDTSDPPGENYNKCAEVLVQYLDSFASKVDVIEVPGESLPRHLSTGKPLSRPNVVAEMVGSKEESCLHFNGHYDVVPATGGWNTPPYKASIKDGRLYGRGSSDMKAGIAAVMVAVKCLKTENIPLRGTISFSFVPDEENDEIAGSKFLIEQQRIQANYCIIAEPSSGTIFNGHKGDLWLEITTHGKAAHASSPWKGHNAFDEMIGVVNEINTKIRPGLFNQEDTNPYASTVGNIGTMTLGGIVSTGESVNVVPSKCYMTVDRRLAPGESVRQILAEFSSILTSLKIQNPKFEGEIKVLSQYEACNTAIESHLVNTLLASLQEITGKPPEISLMTAGCDMRYFHSAGIPTVIYGPGNLSMAHQIDEYVEIRQMITAAQVYALMAIRLLGLQP